MRRRLAAAFPCGFGLSSALSTPAQAHVKWFCAFDVAGQPRSLQNVLCPDFEFLIGLTLLAMMASSFVEGTQLSYAVTRAIHRVTTQAHNHTEMLFRIGCAFFFVSIWAIGGILLTPELKTNSTAIGVLHLVIAAGMLSRSTMPISALGIATVFAIGVWQYGIFHLADYPIFLGVAAYLALTGLQWKKLFGARPLDLVRWSAGITLMWASIEKWAYPEWSFPLLEQ